MTRIVIVDDRITNRNIFSRLASSIEDGVSVEAFGDPREALVWLQRNTPDLIITDFNMPEMDGAEFTRAFRAMPGCSDIPVIVLTVYEERSYRLKALEAGATDFLQSPVDHHEFVTRARNLLRLSRQQALIKTRAVTLERELDASERSRQQVLRDSRERLAQIVDTLPAMVSACDRDGRIVFVNAHQADFYGIDPEAVVGQDVSAVFGDEHGARGRSYDNVVFENGMALPPFEETLISQRKEPRVFLTTKAPLRDSTDKVVHVLTTSLDITDRKRAEEHLLHIAHHDSLTNLPNRTLLQDRIRREIARARRGDRPFALHLLDLDRFKSVNDVLGHHVGDEVLKVMAERLVGTVRETDLVARLGGDEFAVLQIGVQQLEDVKQLAERLIGTISAPLVVEGREIATTVSIGIALHPSDGSDIQGLLKAADLAMYRAKADGRNTYSLFAADMTTLMQEQTELDSALRHAINRKEFTLYYQPQIELATGRIVGVEALIRWRRPGHGFVSPGEFLPLAEENGLIVPISDWVLREACRQSKLWQQLGHNLRVSVNLSPVQFRKQNVGALVVKVLAETGVAPQTLELELTESILMQDPESVAENLRQLQALGVSLAIDDFGTGYSSLAYIKNFPVDRLKIDQGFVRNIEDDPSDAAIVRAIITLGHSLGMDIVAEGVETQEQLSRLIAEGCDEVQGYFYSRPVPPEGILELLNGGGYMQAG